MDVMVIVGVVGGLTLLAGVAVAVRSRRTSRHPSGKPASSVRLICPACGHRFDPPDITILTKADVKKYGRDPVQCPRCHHIWNARRKIRTIRG